MVNDLCHFGSHLVGNNASTLQGLSPRLKMLDKPPAKSFQNPYLPLPSHSAFENVRRDSDKPNVRDGTILSGDMVFGQQAQEIR